jgi:hypothetical protein
MKINQNLGVLAPAIVRKRKSLAKRPPWYVEVPPDTVDIALLPRINRYERGGLRFHHFGSTQQKLADRIAIFRDHMEEATPGVGLTSSEMREGLESVMMERIRLMEEAEQKSIENFGPQNTAQQVKSSSSAAEQSGEAISVDNTADTNEEAKSELKALENMLQSKTAITSTEKQRSKSNQRPTEETDSKKALEGVATDWLIQRLNSIETS